MDGMLNTRPQVAENSCKQAPFNLLRTSLSLPHWLQVSYSVRRRMTAKDTKQRRWTSMLHPSKKAILKNTLKKQRLDDISSNRNLKNRYEGTAKTQLSSLSKSPQTQTHTHTQSKLQFVQHFSFSYASWLLLSLSLPTVAHTVTTTSHTAAKRNIMIGSNFCAFVSKQPQSRRADSSHHHQKFTSKKEEVEEEEEEEDKQQQNRTRLGGEEKNSNNTQRNSKSKKSTLTPTESTEPNWTMTKEHDDETTTKKTTTTKRRRRKPRQNETCFFRLIKWVNQELQLVFFFSFLYRNLAKFNPKHLAKSNLD